MHIKYTVSARKVYSYLSTAPTIQPIKKDRITETANINIVVMESAPFRDFQNLPIYFTADPLDILYRHIQCFCDLL